MRRNAVWINSSILLTVGVLSFGAVLWSDDIPWTHSPAVLASMPSPEKTDGRATVSRQQATYLVRSTMKTLSDANSTGNYTVLRELAGDEFREQYSNNQLASIFGPLRNLPIDLAQLALLEPVLPTAPALATGKYIRVNGFFSTSPVRVAFTMEFASGGGHWKLKNIDVSTHALQAAL